MSNSDLRYFLALIFFSALYSLLLTLAQRWKDKNKFYWILVVVINTICFGALIIIKALY